MVLVTGGCGFIGSALVRHIIATTDCNVVNVDCLTYAATLDSTASVADSGRYRLENVDIRDGGSVDAVFERHRPDTVIHLAAESHVDRSIDGPAVFVDTNIVGTQVLLDAALKYWRALPSGRQADFRFHHVSTDEVFGSLSLSDKAFTPETPYKPNSPYSASKASSDHLVRAWSETYGLPTLISNCSNNYGPYQFPEKLIPLVIIKALSRVPIPVYGTGENVRDWLFVEDHARALWTIARNGNIGETYLVGGGCEKRNIDVVKTICTLLDERLDTLPHEDLITFVDDRPGHDLRYAIDDSHTRSALGWAPIESFETGLATTVDWYLTNREWWQSIQQRDNATDRLGKG